MQTREATHLRPATRGQAAAPAAAISGFRRADFLHPALAGLTIHDEPGVPAGAQLEVDGLRKPGLQPLPVGQRPPQFLGETGQFKFPFDQLGHAVDSFGWQHVQVTNCTYGFVSPSQPPGCSISQSRSRWTRESGLMGYVTRRSWRLLLTAGAGLRPRIEQLCLSRQGRHKLRISLRQPDRQVFGNLISCSIHGARLRRAASSMCPLRGRLLNHTLEGRTGASWSPAPGLDGSWGQGKERPEKARRSTVARLARSRKTTNTRRDPGTRATRERTQQTSVQAHDSKLSHGSAGLIRPWAVIVGSSEGGSRDPLQRIHPR